MTLGSGGGVDSPIDSAPAGQSTIGSVDHASTLTCVMSPASSLTLRAVPACLLPGVPAGRLHGESVVQPASLQGKR